MSATTRNKARSPGLPAGTVRALLASGRVSAATRNALDARIEAEPVGHPRFFDREMFALLRAVCARLVGTEPGPDVDVAGVIDSRLAKGLGDGWRFDSMPQDTVAFTRGLNGIEQAARTLHRGSFVTLGASEQNEILESIGSDVPGDEAWTASSAARFFEELRCEAAAIYFAHPLVQERIGYLGFADVLGWHAIGLDESEYPEPQPRG